MLYVSLLKNILKFDFIYTKIERVLDVVMKNIGILFWIIYRNVITLSRFAHAYLFYFLKCMKIESTNTWTLKRPSFGGIIDSIDVWFSHSWKLLSTSDVIFFSETGLTFLKSGILTQLGLGKRHLKVLHI